MSDTNSEQNIADIANLTNNGSPNVFKRIFGRGNEAFKTILSGSNMLMP